MNSRIRTIAATALIAAAAYASVAHADMDSARQALSNNDFPSAIEALDAVLAEAPDNAEARFLKGLALARSGDTETALTVFNKLVERNPDMAEGWNNLGVLRAREDDLDGAQTALEKAVRINPEHAPAQENLGDIYVAKAQSAYAAAGELESDNSIARTKSQQLAEFIGGGASSAIQASGKRAARVPEVAPEPVEVDTRTPQSTLDSWAAVWSAQDVDAYLAMYSDDFEPDAGMSRSAWAAQRRDRVGSPARIDIDISNTGIARRGEQARATFTQRYQSNTYQDKERKALLLQETADGWQILREGSADDVAFTAAQAPVETESVDAQTVNEAPSRDDVSRSAEPSGQTGSADQSNAAAPASASNTVPAGSAPAQMQAESQAQARQAVKTALRSWASAWSAQDVRGYLNAYSDNYQPRGTTSLSDWVRSRRQSVESPATIKVELSDLQVSLLDDSRAQASFNQHYKSNSYEDRERKRVTLVREDGGWRIVRES